VYNMYSWDQAARATDEHADTEAARAQTQTGSAGRNASTAAHNGSQATRSTSPASRNGQAHSAARNGRAQPVRSAPRQVSAPTRHAQAVQFSLDRRDNGGDAGRTG
jgi:hypothetical protein